MFDDDYLHYYSELEQKKEEEKMQELLNTANTPIEIKPVPTVSEKEIKKYQKAERKIKRRERHKLFKKILTVLYAIICIVIFLASPKLGILIATPLLLKLCFILIREVLHIYWSPFRFLKGVLTNSLPGSPNDQMGMYPNMFQTIFFGIFGNLLYRIILIALFTAIFIFRPYDGGYAVKEANLQVGDTVLVKMEKEKVVTIIDSIDITDDYAYAYVDYNNESTKVNIAIADGEVMPGRILGLYKKNDSNMFFNFWESAWKWLVYMIERVPRIKNWF